MAKPGITLLLLGLAALSAQGAVIRGIVVEKRTGYALSRATVTLEAVSVTGVASRTARSGENGAFEFANLAAGSYLIKATRRGFLPMEYGQRRWNSAGTAVVLESDAVLSLNLQLSRFGAITGTVRDSNEAGIPEQDVAAYTTTQPPQYVSRARSDDRGVFRISGLQPGTYLVRTTGNDDDDRAYLPTFSRQTLRVEEARPLVVYADEDTTDGDVRPIIGRLFELSGNLTLQSPYGFLVTVTLASELGRTTSSGPTFHFSGLAPGRYEIYAEARENAPGGRLLGGYTEVSVERNLVNYALPMNEVRESQFIVEGAGGTASTPGFARRKDLAGTGPVQAVLQGATSRAILYPGRWEFIARPPAGYYVSRFSASRSTTARPDGWNEILTSFYNRFIITLSTGPGSLRGTVRSLNAAAAAAPVFLEAWDPVSRKRLLDLSATRTDAQGNYRFENLAPGDYRILSTFEYSDPDPQAFDAAGALSLRLEAKDNRQVDLELNGLP